MREQQIDPSADGGKRRRRPQRPSPRLDEAAKATCRRQGIAEARITQRAPVHIRYEGSQQALLVKPGRSPPQWPPISRRSTRSASASCRASDRCSWRRSPSKQSASPEDAPGTAMRHAPAGEGRPRSGEARMRVAGEWHSVPVHDRDVLEAGTSVKGPAIIVEPTGTTSSRTAGEASVKASGALILRRHQPRPKTEAIGTSADPIMLEVFNNLFMSIAEQMGVTLANTAFSVNIKERFDFSCAIFDRRRRAGRQRAACAGASRLDGRERRHGHPRECRQHPARRCLHAECAVQWRHAPARRDRRHPGLRRGGRNDPLLYRLARPSRRYRRQDARLLAAGLAPISRRKASSSTISASSRRAASARPRRGRCSARAAIPAATPITTSPTCSPRSRRMRPALPKFAEMIGQFGAGTVQAYMRHVQDNAEESVRRVIDRLIGRARRI